LIVGRKLFAMKSDSAESGPEVLAGLVERVTFHNEENGFAVLRVKARGKRDLVTVVGHAAVISAGEFIQASGDWNNDRQHGLQFRARFLKATPPTTIEGIEKYLGSGMIRGIGPVYAKEAIHAFGERVFDVIEAEPDRLREVTGIGPKRAEGIVAGWAEQRVIRGIMIFLHTNGVGASRAVPIYKTYGNDAVQLISEDPYRLARDIRGIGFRTADAIAMKLGIEKIATIRARAGISYALTESLDDGHCGLPRDQLMPLAVKLLEIPEALITDALNLELEAGGVIADSIENRACVFLAGLYRAEQSIVSRLKALIDGPLEDRPVPFAKCRGHRLVQSPLLSAQRCVRVDPKRKLLLSFGTGELHPIAAVHGTPLTARRGFPTCFSTRRSQMLQGCQSTRLSNRGSGRDVLGLRA
jgi:exodeoxyribonuclease V alpha subunit